MLSIHIATKVLEEFFHKKNTTVTKPTYSIEFLPLVHWHTNVFNEGRQECEKSHSDTDKVRTRNCYTRFVHTVV